MYQKGSLDTVSSGTEEKKGAFGEISGLDRGVVSNSLFWDFTQCEMVVTDVSVQPISSVFNGMIVLCNCALPDGGSVRPETCRNLRMFVDCFTLEMRQMGCKTTSVTKNLRCIT
jgi:hypothetical protein